LAAAVASVVLWTAAYWLLPMRDGTEDLRARLLFALKWVCVAILFCLVTGVEAVSHRGLFSRAIDPLIGAESGSLRVDIHYLQNTVEQTLVFIPGLFGLAYFSSSARSIHAVSATALVWMISRFAFWIGYHKGPRYRGVGLTGLAQSILVLLYVCARFGYEEGGMLGAAVPVAIFLGMEALLVRLSLREG
jgi:hypothetical protein